MKVVLRQEFQQGGARCLCHNASSFCKSMFKSAPTPISRTECAAHHCRNTSMSLASVVIQRASVPQLVGMCAETKAMWPHLFVLRSSASHLSSYLMSKMLCSHRRRMAMAVSAGWRRFMDERELQAVLLHLQFALRVLEHRIGVGPAGRVDVPGRRRKHLSALPVRTRYPSTHMSLALCFPSGARRGCARRAPSFLHLLRGCRYRILAPLITGPCPGLGVDVDLDVIRLGLLRRRLALRRGAWSLGAALA